MRNELLLKAADILEKTAAYIDGVESEKQAAEKVAKDAAVKSIAARYAEVTGESLEDAELNKLASDATALETVRKMLDKTGGAVESLGRPGRELVGVRPPAGKEEARKQAVDRFAVFLQS